MFLSCLSFSQMLLAQEKCAVQEASSAQHGAQARQTTVQFKDDSTITVVGQKRLDLISQLKTLDGMISKYNVGGLVERNLKKLLATDLKVQFDQAKFDLAYLQRRLKNSHIKFMGIDMTAKEAKLRLKMTNEIEFALNLEFKRLKINNDKLRNDLLLTLVGPLFYLKFISPQKLSMVTLIGLKSGKTNELSSSQNFDSQSDKQDQFLSWASNMGLKEKQSNTLKKELERFSYYYYLILPKWQNYVESMTSKYPDDISNRLISMLGHKKVILKAMLTQDALLAKSAKQNKQSGLLFVDQHRLFSIVEKLREPCH